MNRSTLHQRAITRGLIFRALVVVVALVGVGQLHAQPLDTLSARVRGLPLDSLIAREAAATDPRVKCAVIARLVSQYLFLGRPEDCMKAAIRGLEAAEPTGNDTLIGRAHFGIGGAFMQFTDLNGALKHFNIAFERFQHAGDSLGMGAVCKETAIVYQRAGDAQGALRYMRKAQAFGLSEGIYGRSMSILARCHLELGDLDSALYYARKADVLKVPGNDPYGYANFQLTLATVHAARGENDLAEPYFKRALTVADSADVPEPLINAAAGYAKLLIGQGRTAEALAWARKGHEATGYTRLPHLMVKSTTALSDAFAANGITDSALVCSKLAHAWRDSLIVLQNKSQLQNQLFTQELKDREDAQLRAEAVAARSRNIQFGIIALIVITLGIFLLIFSRTSVVGAKAIKNLSLIALLLFFEFINLLVHPVLGDITHHSPLLMLLCMAAIAALLIPLHHRMEKLITNMLVSKNNRVRLEAARRTIEELEARPTDTNAG
ncbi:MAG: tetratricopeptide repeat protein [Flavobacteriales bacterium]|nr:tetratricopeptide repeat protein [Flavobacteriales bacterium]